MPLTVSRLPLIQSCSEAAVCVSGHHPFPLPACLSISHRFSDPPSNPYMWVKLENSESRLQYQSHYFTGFLCSKYEKVSDCRLIPGDRTVHLLLL